MRCSGRSFQQNSKKESCLLHWWINIELEQFLTSIDALLQHQLPLIHCHYPIWIAVWCQTTFTITTLKLKGNIMVSPLQLKDSKFFNTWDNKLSKWLNDNIKNTKRILTRMLYHTNFKLDKKVWRSENWSIGKNAKLTPKWIGPFEIIDVNDTNVRIKLKNGNLKVVNVMWVKPFLEDPKHRLVQGDLGSSQCQSYCPFQDNSQRFPNRPLTSALSKLIQFKNAAAMAVKLFENKICEDNTSKAKKHWFMKI